MRSIQILDCTLRDGGYCNNWIFGNKTICDTTINLIEAGVDYVEFGLLSNQAPFNEESTYYPSFSPMDNNRKKINARIRYDVSSKLR